LKLIEITGTSGCPRFESPYYRVVNARELK
jgi:hypothetical protein